MDPKRIWNPLAWNSLSPTTDEYIYETNSIDDLEKGCNG